MDRAETCHSVEVRGIRRVFFRLVNVFGFVAVAGTVMGCGARQHWIADAAVQFRVQYLILLVPSVALWIGKRFCIRSIAGGLALAVNSWLVVPYFILPSRATPPTHAMSDTNDPALRLVMLNVLRTNEEIQDTLKEVVDENADFVFLMEVAPAWSSQLEDLKDRYPYQTLLCRKDYTGVAFLSMHPWNSLEVVDTSDANPPLEFIFPRLGNQPAGFRLIATHPLPPFGSHLTSSRDRQLSTLAKRCRVNLASLLIGDFNLTPWSPRFHQVLKVGKLRDVSLGCGISPTLAPLPTVMGGLKVDHVLADSRVTIEDFRLGSSAHSDHKRVIVDFRIREAVR